MTKAGGTVIGAPRRSAGKGPTISVVGAGMAGSEAALAAAGLGVRVELFEMRPKRLTPAHVTGDFAEMVCSNSLGGEGRSSAKGLLQAEMLLANGVIMRSAHASRVPAGGALAVDRNEFSRAVTAAVREHPLIDVREEEVTEVPSGTVVLATGPLTSNALAESISGLVGEGFLDFYDAAAPIIEYDSIDMSVAYRKGRWDQPADYINLPFTKEQYEAFHAALTAARSHTPRDWENLEFFEACTPVEELGRRGVDTLRFGPLRPVGLEHPVTGERFHAVAQLRQEDRRGQMWSLVGFQTGLKWGDQRDLVRLIPGLENAEVVRYGVMHRNTYLNAPALIGEGLALKREPRVHVAGVLGGVEGYLESSAMGYLAGVNAARRALGLPPVAPPEESMLGALANYLATAEEDGFQPMNANWGLVPALTERELSDAANKRPAPAEPGGRRARRRLGRKERREALYDRGLSAFAEWLRGVHGDNEPGERLAAGAAAAGG